MKFPLGLLLTLLWSLPVFAWDAVERAAVWTRTHDAIHDHFTGFDDSSLAAWDRSYEPVLRELVSAPSDLEFWRMLRRKVATLGDGRTAVQLPNDLARTLDTVPIRFIIAGNRVLVKQLSSCPAVQASGVHVGDELIAVDNMPVLDHLRENCIPDVNGSSYSQRMAEAMWRMLLGDSSQPAHLVFHKPNGTEYSVTLPRQSGQNNEYMRELSKFSGRFAKQLPGSAVYMEIGQWLTMNTEDMILQQLDENPRAEWLIFDFRETKNGQVPWRVLERLALFPLPAGATREVDWRTIASPNEPAFISLVRAHNSLPARMIQPADNPHHARIVALVSAETAGPAEQFLEPLVFADRVVLIGDTTAGAGGQSLQLAFGQGGNLFVTVREPQWEHGYGNGKGFPPRIFVEPTAKGLSAGKDELLDRAISFINERAN